MTNKTRFNVGYAIAALFVVFLIQYFISSASQIASIPYSEFQQLLQQGKVSSVGVSGRMLQGTLKQPLPGGQKQFVTARVDPRCQSFREALARSATPSSARSKIASS